ISGRAVVKAIWVLGPLMLNRMVSATPPPLTWALASRMACRNEPAPLGSVLVTKKVAGTSRPSSASTAGRKPRRRCSGRGEESQEMNRLMGLSPKEQWSGEEGMKWDAVPVRVRLGGRTGNSILPEHELHPMYRLVHSRSLVPLVPLVPHVPKLLFGNACPRN